MARTALSLAFLAFFAVEASAQAAAAKKAARELVDALRSKFAREVAEEGAEKLERKFASAIAAHGDDVASAARLVGPRVALSVIQRHGAPGAKILAKFGDNGARILALEETAVLRAYGSLGDDGVGFMIRTHGKLKLTPKIMPDLAAPIARSGRANDVLKVMERYGDAACSFIWRNKGVIFGSAALAAFLANPEPYINGIRPLAELPIARIAEATDWTAVFLMATLLLAALAAIRMLLLRRPRQDPPASPRTEQLQAAR